MSKFREIVESVLAEMMPREFDYWRTTNQKYEDDGAYEDWLELQEPEAVKFAGYIGEKPNYGKLYINIDTSTEIPEFNETNDLTIEYEPEDKCMWDSAEEANQAIKQWIEKHPDQHVSLTKIYTKDMKNWSEDPEEIWTYEDWKEESNY